MSDLILTRRGFLAAAGVTTLVPSLLRASRRDVLVASTSPAQIAPDGYPATEVYSYDGQFPGPLIKAGQGERIQKLLKNTLSVPTSVHWHGIRIENAMDGVAGLTQKAVPPGGEFAYDFAVPDAGTYWYHAHTNSMEQVARGLYGPLIVDETEPPDVDQDEILILDDWLLDPDTAQFWNDFDHPMMMSHGGRLGNLIGTNGQSQVNLSVKRHERLRLRLINAANARIFTLGLIGLEGWIVATDGMPLAAPQVVDHTLILAPAQRIDLIVDVTADKGAPAALVRRDDDGEWRSQVSFTVDSVQASVRRPVPAPLPPNPAMDLPDLSQARALEMVMEGGAMAGMQSAIHDGQQLGFRSLMQRGQFWALSGQAGMPDTPFASLSLGESIRMKLINRTVFPHAMHLHGMHFREVLQDGTFGPMRDTILSLPDEPLEIAFDANNPGKWLLHCHMLAHAKSGMTTWLEVS
jgi:FtsP/CotA-like multicopper oxidase with cupredoxin domain